jgi:hypothetical protein
VTEAEYWLRENFAALELPPDAVAWLIDLWHVTQVFDDVADGDPVDRKSLDDTVWRTLVGMPANSFFMAHAGQLLPAVGMAILKWKASDDAERNGLADERSFVWRAAYYDLVLLVVLLCQGRESAMEKAGAVMALYGESFATYRGEFPHA